MKTEELFEGCDIWNLIEEIDQEKDSFEEYMETLSDIEKEELQEFILMLSEEFEDDSMNEFFFKFVENNNLETKALNEIFDYVIQHNEGLAKAIAKGVAKGVGKAAVAGVKAATAGKAQDFVKKVASGAKSNITKTKEYEKFKKKRAEKKKVKDARKSAIRKAKTRASRLKSVAKGRAKQAIKKAKGK